MHPARFERATSAFGGRGTVGFLDFWIFFKVSYLIEIIVVCVSSLIAIP